ncbi:hypothetical protein Vretifemale_2438 [Volvox reticuliferus]|nr:hypothetical protein Vretifemale_2438 [Volvox reticuliferus]
MVSTLCFVLAWRGVVRDQELRFQAPYVLSPVFSTLFRRQKAFTVITYFRCHWAPPFAASGVKPPYTAGGLSLGPQGPRSKDWSGLVVPVAEYRAATTRPGPLPMHNFHVVCHMDAIRMCIAGKSPVFRVVFLEAVSQFVESEYKLQLSRTTRTLQVHRDAVSEEELQELRLQQQQQVQACVGLELQPDRPAGDSVLPKGLLEELQSLGKPATKPSPVQGSGNPVPAAGAQTPRKALIEELN